MAPTPRDEIAKLEALYASNPDGRVFTHLAEAYRKVGELRKARETLEQGLRRHPDYASAHVVMGRVLADDGDGFAAATSFRRVLELDPENLIARRSLAESERDGGNFDAALTHYRELLAYDPGDEDVQHAIDDLQRRLSPQGPTSVEPSAEPDYAAGTTFDEFGPTTTWQEPGDEGGPPAERIDDAPLSLDAGAFDFGTPAGEDFSPLSLDGIDLGETGTTEADSAPATPVELPIDGPAEVPAEVPEEAPAGYGLDDGLPASEADIWQASDSSTDDPETDAASEGFVTDDVWGDDEGDTESAAVENLGAALEFEEADSTAEPEDVTASDVAASDFATGNDLAGSDVDDDGGFVTPSDIPAEPEYASVSDTTRLAAGLRFGDEEESDSALDLGADESPTDPGMATETLAELYRSQGFPDRAAQVYRVLLAARPDDQRLAERLRDAEQAADEARAAARSTAAGVDEAREVWLSQPGSWDTGRGVDTDPDDTEPVDDDGPTIGTYFSSLLSWRPASVVGAPEDGAPPSDRVEEPPVVGFDDAQTEPPVVGFDDAQAEPEGFGEAAEEEPLTAPWTDPWAQPELAAHGEGGDGEGGDGEGGDGEGGDGEGGDGEGGDGEGGDGEGEAEAHGIEHAGAEVQDLTGFTQADDAGMADEDADSAMPWEAASPFALEPTGEAGEPQAIVESYAFDAEPDVSVTMSGFGEAGESQDEEELLLSDVAEEPPATAANDDFGGWDPTVALADERPPSSGKPVSGLTAPGNSSYGISGQPSTASGPGIGARQGGAASTGAAGRSGSADGSSGAPAPAPGAAGSGAGSESEDDDLEMFRSWLQSLKK